MSRRTTQNNRLKIPTYSFWVATIMAVTPLLLGVAASLFFSEPAGLPWFVLIFIISIIGIIASVTATMNNKNKILRALIAVYITWFVYQLGMSIYAVLVSGVWQ